MASGFQRALQCLSIIENAILSAFIRKFPPGSLAPALVNLPAVNPVKPSSQSWNELLKNAILWGVPKKRTTIEKRRSRKYGWPDQFYKMLVPKTNILICTKCGSYHEAGLLCPKCYNRIKKETEEMQEAIQANLGISAVDTEVVVLYSGEKAENPEMYQGKRIIEMKKERPKIFSNNLLQGSTQGASDSKEMAKSEDISVK